MNKKPISRQRKAQLRNKKNGLCIKCSNTLWAGFSKSFCEKHALWTREYYRNYKGNKRRNINSKSYIDKDIVQELKDFGVYDIVELITKKRGE